LWKQLGETLSAFGIPHVKNRILDFWMTQKNPGQLKAGISSDTHHRDLAKVAHF
jgi:hypothetical protein